jgi:hypothetical protein
MNGFRLTPIKLQTGINEQIIIGHVIMISQ